MKDTDILFDLSAPAPLPLVGDVVLLFLDLPLSEILASLLREPVRQTDNGQLVYPCRLPAGEGLHLGLRQLGAIGFMNDNGILVVYVPPSLASTVRPKLGAVVVHEAQTPYRGSPCYGFWCNPRHNQGFTVSLGPLGGIGFRFVVPETTSPALRRSGG